MHYYVGEKCNENVDEIITKLLEEDSQDLFGLKRKEFDNIVKYDILNILASFYAKMDTNQKALLLDTLSKKLSLFHMEGVMNNLVMFADADPYIPLSCRLVSRLNDSSIVKIVYQTLFKYGATLTILNWNQSNSYSNYLVLLNIAYFTALSIKLHTEDSYVTSMRFFYSQNCFDDYIEHIYEMHLDDMNWDVNVEVDVLEKMILNSEESSAIREGSKEEFFDAAEIMESIIQDHCPVRYGEKKKKDGDFKVKKTGIRELDISARSRACLIRAGYEDISELKDISDEELLKIKNLNMSCVREIRAIINEHFGVFEDIEILNMDNDQIRVEFCGIDFNEYSEKLTMSIWVYNHSYENYKIWIKELYINGMLIKPYLWMGTIKSKEENYYEGTISNVENVEYKDIKNIVFSVEIDDNNNHELANSKVVYVECDTTKEIFDLVKLEEYGDEESEDNSIALVEGIDELELSVRAYNCLKREGIDTIEDVCELTPTDLMHVRNLGGRCFKEILEKLSERGLSLKEDEGNEEKDDEKLLTKIGFPKMVEVPENHLIAECIDEIEIDIEEAYWKINSKLYVPHLKVSVTNKSNEDINRLTLKALFYNTKEKELWDDAYDTVASNNPLKPGDKTNGFLSANVGYANKMTETSLPAITAQLFFDGKYYGDIEVPKSYSADSDTKSLEGVKKGKYSFIKYDEREYCLIVTNNQWKLDDELFVPSLNIDVINQTVEVKSKTSIRAVFYDLENKKIWSEKISDLITPERPLLPGYKKTAFIKGNHGYSSKLSESLLPVLYTEIYVNDDLYGHVKIRNEYKSMTGITFVKKDRDISLDTSFERKSDRCFYPVVVTSCWTKSQDLYVPYLKLDIINQQETLADSISVRVIFSNTGNKELWSEAFDYLIGLSDTPLKTGFKKSSFIRGTRGYTYKIEERDLPGLMAEVFINGESYGETAINKTYDLDVINQPLKEKQMQDKDEGLIKDLQGRRTATEKDESSAFNMWNDQSFLGERGYSTSKPAYQRHLILDKAVKECGKQRVIDHISFLINIRLAQDRGAIKFSNAIKKWRDDLSYIRDL